MGDRVSVSICILMRKVTPIGIGGILDALVAHNVEIMRLSNWTTPPWHLRWRPDDFDNVVILQDVTELYQRGYGSCGPLACAYAAWEIHRGRDAGVRLISNGPQSWHVVAESNGNGLRDGDARRIFDPQTIGGGTHGRLNT